MPDEFSRTTSRKTVVLPGGDKIKVPVITRISFIDPYDRYQETEHSLDNTSESNRIAHVDEVHAVDVDEDGVPTAETPVADTSEALHVERIDTWNAVDPYDRYQETQLSLDNVTGNDAIPPHFETHASTHIYRYHQDPNNPDDDNGIWIDSELIDEFSVVDPYDRYQETHYTLDNPTNSEFRDGDLSGQASVDDPDITIGDGSGEGTLDNPVRLDPFQNIVNYSLPKFIVVQLTGISVDPTTANASGGLLPLPRPGVAYTRDYLVSYRTGLTFNGSVGQFVSFNSAGEIDTGPPITTGLVWSYSGGGTAIETVGTNSFLGINAFGTTAKESVVAAFHLEDIATATTYPGWPDSFSASENFWAYGADGPWLHTDTLNYVQSSSGGGVSLANYAQPAVPPDVTGSGANGIYLYGDIIKTRTYDLSTVTMTYLGAPYHPVSAKASQFVGSVSVPYGILVLCKRGPA